MNDGRADHARTDPASAVEARLYRSVFDGVMSRRLTPGTKLPEIALAELFGVSRAVVRKVLQRLANDHIVQLRPNRGAIVAVPSIEETQQLFEARRSLEAALVRLAAERATPDELQALRAHLRDEHRAMHDSSQPEWAGLASRFHLRVAALARNPMLERFLIEVVSRCSLIVALYEAPGNASCEHDEHARIVDCLARGDADEAVRCMDAHLVALERHLSLRTRAGQGGLAEQLGLA